MKRDNKAILFENQIKFHDECYWVKNKSKIKDEEYDKLVESLLELEPENEYLKKPKTPVVDSKGKVKHVVKMLSLNKVYSFAGILKWCKKVARTYEEKFDIMPKYDGVSGDLRSGILATRGDGEIGENITHKLPFMNIMRKDENNPDVRGEILFKKSTFTEIKDSFRRKGGELYKNERNAVGGMLTRDDLNVMKVLTFIDFKHTVNTITLKQLEDGGEEEWNNFVSMVQDSDFPVDGIVVQLNDKSYGESFGATRHHRKDSIAFKFANPFAWSKIIDIIWSAGKHVLTPVATIEPVEISGVTVQRVSLHNMKNIKDRDICIGDSVKVERAGDVIPYIAEVVPGENRVGGYITTCPICAHDIEFIDPELVCVNKDCAGKHINALMDAVERIGIERLGEPTLKKMIETLGVTDLIDVFNLTKEDIITLEGFKEKSTDNLFNEIQKPITNGVYEWQLLSCLNIEGIGRSLSKDLLEKKDLFDLTSYSVSDWELIDGIGPERANALVKGLLNNGIYLSKLSKILPIKTPNKKVDINGLISICFTGKFPKNKKEYYAMLEDYGGYNIMDKVNKQTEILVVADPSKSSNKMKAAEKKGIQIMGIDELLEIING